MFVHRSFVYLWVLKIFSIVPGVLTERGDDIKKCSHFSWSGPHAIHKIFVITQIYVFYYYQVRGSQVRLLRGAGSALRFHCFTDLNNCHWVAFCHTQVYPCVTGYMHVQLQRGIIKCRGTDTFWEFVISVLAESGIIASPAWTGFSHLTYSPTLHSQARWGFPLTAPDGILLHSL